MNVLRRNFSTCAVSFSKNNSALQLSYEELCPQVAPVIFLHGMMSCKQTWKKCATHVANKTGSRVYYYDARNHGCSPLNEDMSYDAMTEDLASFMNIKKIQKAVIVGHSMGGKTGLNFATKYPEKVHSLIVEDITLQMNAEAKTVSKHIFQVMNETIREIPSGVELSEAKRFFASCINKKFEHKIGKSRSILKLEGLLKEKCEDGRIQWKKNFYIIENNVQNGNLTQDITDGGYKGPVLMIYGTDSRCKVFQDKDNMLKRFPNTIYVPIEGGGHHLHLEFPDTFHKLVCDFIIKNRSM